MKNPGFFDTSKSNNGTQIVFETSFVRTNKYPIIVTICFFILMSYASSQTLFWFGGDGIILLHAGEAILSGEGKNVSLTGAAPGGPVIFAVMNSLIHDGVLTEKIISLLSGTGIVFVSYFIIKNIAGSKAAILGQLFIAFNPRLEFSSTLTLDELLPIFLIAISLYFITKKPSKLSDEIISAVLLGAAFMIRYQAAFVLLAILIFILIRDKKIKTNFVHAPMLLAVFLIVASPMIIYNYSTWGQLVEDNSNIYFAWLWKYQTPQLHEKLTELVATESPPGIFLNFNLFLKNYFYDLFYSNPNRLFNFDSLNNLSILPPVPFIGIVPFIVGFIYCLKIKAKKTNLTVLLGTAGGTSLIISILGDFTTHFFVIIIMPLLALGILNFKKIEKNFLPLLILPVVYLPIISIIPTYRVDQLYPAWFLFPTLYSIFFLKIMEKEDQSLSTPNGKRGRKYVRITFLAIIVAILIVNLGFSYMLFESTTYNISYNGLTNMLSELFQKKSIPYAAMEPKIIGELLSKQKGITNSYVMTDCSCYAYYANSKFVYSNFQEGTKNDTLNQFISRNDWSPYDLYVSNYNSYPLDRNNIYHPVADYLIYTPLAPDPAYPWGFNKTRAEQLSILSDPTNLNIPSNFQLFYKSNYTGTVVYKINHTILQ